MSTKTKELVRVMAENEGVYICGDSKITCATIVLVSKGGKLFSTKLDAVLSPEGFLDTLIVRAGPFK